MDLARKLARLELARHGSGMAIPLPASWQPALESVLQTPRLRALSGFLKAEEDAGKIIYPPRGLRLAALELTPRGRTRLAEAWGIVEQFEIELLARVPEPHRDHLLPALNALWQSPLAASR